LQPTTTRSRNQKRDPLSTSGPGARFSIPADASLQERRPRTLKHGDTFAVFDHNGDVLSGPRSPEGIFHQDTRYLSHLYLTIGGERPMLLSSTVRDDNATMTCDLTNPDLHNAGGELILEHDLIHIRRSRFLWRASCFEHLSIQNHDAFTRRLNLEISFHADFADLFEVRGALRPQHGTHLPTKSDESNVILAYSGLDGQRRETHVRFSPEPSSLSPEIAIFKLDIGPGERRIIFMEIRCGSMASASPLPRNFFIALRDARRAIRASVSRAASVATSNSIFNEAVRRSVADLYLLITNTPEGPFPYAGIPWFSTIFGRDALITALQTLWLDPTIARGVLDHLAANQANDFESIADAEPGKILHEVRHGEMAKLGEVPFRRYYGSVDSTPLFVMLAGAYVERTADLDTARRLWPNLLAAIDWIILHGDRDGDGFVEYGRRAANGLVNQGWKDSYDSIFHADGTLAKESIALAEVQAYVYGAFRAAAEIARRLGENEQSTALGLRAEAFRKHFDDAFFDSELGTYVLALDREKKRCRVRTSNAGHALFTGIAYAERVPMVIETLMSRSSFSGWGVRTVAATEARYNPMSYHNGSVWPHDNALLAAGFARYGFRAAAARIFEGLFSASIHSDLRRLPELICGFPRQRAQGPTFYPVACTPQAWAAATPLSLIQSCLGLGFDTAALQVTFNSPFLPSFLQEVTLRRLTVGSCSVDVALRRSGSEVVLSVLERSGPIRVTTTS
jgi:glycogen debranching enzyme